MAMLASFFGWFRLITDEVPMFIFLTVEIFHSLVSFGPGGHLNKSESFGSTGKLIGYKFGTDHTSVGRKKLNNFDLGDIKWQAADKKLQTVSPYLLDQQKLFRHRAMRIDAAGGGKEYALAIKIIS